MKMDMEELTAVPLKEADSGAKIIDKMPKDQSVDSLEKSLPDQSLEGLLSGANGDAKKVSDSDLF